MKTTELTIKEVVVKDIRFPTSEQKDGSDAMHPDPDYSCAYVLLMTEDPKLVGHGLSFTIGKGTEIVVQAAKSLSEVILNRKLEDILNNLGQVWRELSSHSQLRWIGPEKGAIHLGLSAIVNAIWDLWAKLEKKPLWKLLVDMDPERVVSTIDFRYISDILTKEEALELLKKEKPFHSDREERILTEGYPAYTTSVGWIGYSDEKIRKLCQVALAEGYTCFKAKVGDNLESDKRRLRVIREEIGYGNKLMVDANQKWEVQEAIQWMIELKEFLPYWIEEPTSPDDILGHQEISEALSVHGIGVATGEQCQNRVIFKQLLKAKAIQFCQIDSCRLGSINEIMAVILMAAKHKVPVCPHAGGVGLCEYVNHIAVWDFICVTGKKEDRMVEYVDHLHDIFEDPVQIRRARYLAPIGIGYGGHMKKEAMDTYEYPNGSYWSSKGVNS